MPRLPLTQLSHQTLRRAGALAGAALALALSAAWAAPAGAVTPPDPLDRGPYTVTTMNPFRAGLVTLHEPESGGGAASGANSEITLQIRGSLYYPGNRSEQSPLIVLVHGNHSSCDSGSAPSCTVFKRNDLGYAYMAENLASWGYAVASLDQDQLMSRQDSAKGKGMHQRRRLITALLDALYEASDSGLPLDADTNVGDALLGKLDMTRIGMMGHSRGGDAVANFLDHNRMRPEPGRRYPIRGVISLAPTDYERHAPYGSPYMAILPFCDGDVSNLMGARFYERSQYVSPDDPYPKIQSSQLGGNHNWYNSVWFADGDDSSTPDAACGTSDLNHIRLSGGTYVKPSPATNDPPPEQNTRTSGDPSLMGDQERVGLATMSAFFRRYVGGEGAFEPYLTGELNAEGEPELPASACPSVAPAGPRIACRERVSTSYFAGGGERLDVVRPEADNPLGLSALGTKLTGSGFSNPYPADGGVTPVPPSTAGGYDWCNPEPTHFAPTQLGHTGIPTAVKQCPLPGTGATGGQAGTRENAPVNHAYGRQLSLAWENPAAGSGEPAQLATTIPAADGDVSGFRSLAMGADVNFFDSRNPARTATAAEWDPAQSTQDFEIALFDSDGNEGVVAAGDQRYGNALHQTTGANTTRVHIVLDQIRVPLSDFADQGVDLSSVSKLELRFGGPGMPATGSIQLADVRFQEPVAGSAVLLDSTAPNAGPATGPPSSGPDPAATLDSFDRSDGETRLPDVVGVSGAPTVWTVDDDGVQCPAASFTSIQAAVDQAAPWDTLVVCAGDYAESSSPPDHASNPVEPGATNGLTITKPLRIKGAGADKVTIRPAAPVTGSLAGLTPNLRDGAGNVVTVSRQSLGSTDDVEHFVDISGVTITSPDSYAEAGIAFLNASGRVTDSVVGPLRRAETPLDLTLHPHGWGVIATNSLIGVGPGTVRRQVTVDRSVVTGYQSGGILFDGSRGADADSTTTSRSGIRSFGYVTDSAVLGTGADDAIPQTGIRYHAGVGGFVRGSQIAGNLSPANPRSSVGILLTDADTSQWHATGNLIAGNGYGLFNASADNSAVRDGAPALASGNFWGTAGTPVEGPSLPASGTEGTSGDDAGGNDSVLVAPVAANPPEVPGSGTPATADDAPTGSVVDPADGTVLAVDQQVKPVVRASDDHAVKSVTMSAGGESLGSDDKAPFEFAWAPAAPDAGHTVALQATITDSAGQSSQASIEVEVEVEVEVGGGTPPLECPGGAARVDGSCPNLTPTASSTPDPYCAALEILTVSTLLGTRLADRDLRGGPANDSISGLGGPDTIHGEGGDDCLRGQRGGDALYGGAGADWLRGSSGLDLLVGGPGDDVILGSRGADRVQARDGSRDRVDCGAGRGEVAVVDARDSVRGCEVVRSSG